MCLSTVTEIVKKPTNKEVWAWKVFAIRDGKLDFVFYSFRVPRRGVWLKAVPPRYKYAYPISFHSFQTKREAIKSWLNTSMPWRMRVVLKVHIRRICARGTQDGLRSLVAREIFIPRGKP